MELKTYFAQDASGNIMPGATVTVYEAGTATLATGLQDESGSPLANPFTADSSAKVAFYAPDGLYDITVVGNGRTVTIRAQFVSVDGASVLRDDLASPGGSAMVGYDGGTAQDVLDGAKPMANYTALRNYTGRATGVRITQSGLAGFFQRDDADTTSADNGGTIIVDASGRRWKRVFDGAVSVKWFGAVGNGVVDDTSAIRAAWNSIADGGELTFPSASAYKITDTLQFFDKGRVRVDFNGQLIDASGFTGGARPALHFKGISHSRIGGIFVIGNLASVSHGVLFDADADSIAIHAVVGKIHASGCNIGVMVGNDQGYQFSDSSFEDIYGADCNIGVYFTGENTLAMYYQRVAAYNNNTYGVLIEQGGGCIASLQVADSGIDIYFGAPAGTNGNKLNRWDITSGYSEEGANGEVFIGSTACADTNPFREQIVLRGFRCTPFSSTNIEDFVRWNLNGDLIFRECTFTHGTQLPKAKLDANGAYRAPRLVLDDCVVDCAPTTAVQVPLSYQVTTTKQRVDMDCAVNNGMTFWQNNGSANEGLIKRGIYTSKIKLFEQALRNVAGLKGAWSLRDITSGQCENLVADMPNLSLSASAQRRDVWMDDGLIGFFKNATTSKTLSTTSAMYSAGEYTFGCFLRTSVAGVDETDFTALGGAGGINLAVGDTGGGFVRCMVGGTNAQGTPTHPLDPHLVIGRYVPGASVKMSAINLRTGEVIQASAGSGPALVDLTWANGVSLRNDFCVRGFPFVYSRALTDNEVGQILQAAMLLTDSWRQ